MTLPSRRTGPSRLTWCLTRLRSSQVRMNVEYASKSRWSLSMPAASYPYMSAWFSVVPRPRSGSSTVSARPAIWGANADAIRVTLSSSFVNCSPVLPGYFWVVIRSSS